MQAKYIDGRLQAVVCQTTALSRPSYLRLHQYTTQLQTYTLTRHFRNPICGDETTEHDCVCDEGPEISLEYWTSLHGALLCTDIAADSIAWFNGESNSLAYYGPVALMHS